MLVLIAALSRSDRAIGKQGKLPWSIPDDLKRFQQLTLNHTVIMGRKTWEFDLEKRPLKNRSNVVISSTLDDHQAGIQVVRSLDEALVYAQDCAFIIGGASIYTQALDRVDRWEFTIVEGNYEGDVFFPPYESLINTQFECVQTEQHEGYRFETYEKIDFEKRLACRHESAGEELITIRSRLQ